MGYNNLYTVLLSYLLEHSTEWGSIAGTYGI